MTTPFDRRPPYTGCAAVLAAGILTWALIGLGVWAVLR